MEIILKDGTIFFLIANRNKCFISSERFFPLGFFFLTFFCIYWKQDSIEWIFKEEEVIHVSCREIGKQHYIQI